MTHSDVDIASVARELLGEIYRIELESFSEPYPFHFFTVMATEMPETFLVATLRSKIVGYVLTSLIYDSAHILSIAVLRDFRRKGIGSKLMLGLIDVLRRKGIRRVELEVRVSNHIARMFYEMFGFREVTRVEAYYEDGEDAVKMMKDLSSKDTSEKTRCDSDGL